MNGGRLAEKVVVTGAARGQGAAAVTALEREGATVIATDRNSKEGVRRLDVTLADDRAARRF
ncbi:SDR family NAD(P)-dependent oxidoreductase [Streptomyces sp. NPDC003036]|uniref:SDR family NAD(P)-dependent oxidoreductase n=1 Tax=Streptomyces sp. NPDC003036 TaxID=3154442 RepID=UPI0033B40777